MLAQANQLPANVLDLLSSKNRAFCWLTQIGLGLTEQNLIVIIKVVETVMAVVTLM